MGTTVKIKMRKDRNRIERLKKSAGQWIQGGDEILKLVEEYFPKLFTSKKRGSLQECITKILRKITNEKNLISDIKLAPTAPSITYLFFADDCIIFAEAKEEEVYQIIQVLNQYTEASGQRINLEKSGISFGSIIPIQTRANIEEILCMAAWENPGKYVGLPARWEISKNKALECIEEKVMNKMEGWKEKLLNQVGKEVLIKSFIQAIPAYTMNVMKFPKKFCRRLSVRVAKFWWASSGKESGIHWKSWAKFSRSKEDEGLGFKDFELKNLAHLAKHAWRILIYFSNNNFWKARAHRGASWVWRNILEGRNFLRRKGSWSIGNRSEVEVWGDNWVEEKHRLEAPENARRMKVKELLVEGQGWDANKVHTLFPIYLSERILRTPVSLVDKNDTLIWPYKMDGDYTVKIGYYAAKEEKKGRKRERMHQQAQILKLFRKRFGECKFNKK
ncbi:hypothetical protein Ahy_A06g026672 [Arachis hypogaea]|uniref:Uncharacterized protein n=1 Tax=Arachis hypogaea TaxID=3818 RepID=A0A445CLB3_ARAHY|nr:hypothetical protein Ahy_A06g026672 [Arachis hypogaea]